MSLVPYQHPRRTIPRRSWATQTHTAYAFSAPLRGIDVTQPLPGGDPLTAIRLDNLIPRVLGCQLRKGYTRWVSKLSGEVRSLMQFHPATGSAQMFAATSNNDVYDVTLPTASTVTPVPVLTVTGAIYPGEWHAINYTTEAGVELMLAVCQGAGYYAYDGTVWTPILQGTGVGQIEGVNPATFSYVMVYMNRVWFVQAGTTRAWYLPVGVYAGKATFFDFGPMLPNGGQIAALATWNYDGGGGGATPNGSGMSNKLVIIADQGDVLVYGGIDPDNAATFQSEGRWYIGRVPIGTRFLSNYSTDLAILSERGMVFMSELLRGQGFFQNAVVASDINSALAVNISQTLDSRYWEVKFLPHEQLIVINTPNISGVNYQWAYEVNNKAFCALVGIPMLTVDTFDGRTFCGDPDGNVWWCFQGNSDGQVDDVPGKDLLGTVVTSFQPMGEGIRVKRFNMVRASFISSSPPGFQAQLNREWALSLPAGSPAYLAAGENLWDSGRWDVAVWAGEGQSYESWVGTVGTGRYAALALQVRGAADTIFVGWQAVVEDGGIL